MQAPSAAGPSRTRGPGISSARSPSAPSTSATVDVNFDTEAFSITYKDSQNLNHDASRSEIHPNYNSWVQNLQKDIQSEIALMRSGA